MRAVLNTNNSVTKRAIKRKLSCCNFALNMPPFKYMNFFTSEKGFSHLLLIVLLIAGIGVGTFLVQQRLNIFPKASSAITFVDENGTEISETDSPLVKIKLTSPWAYQDSQVEVNSLFTIESANAYHEDIGTKLVGATCKDDDECSSGDCCTGSSCGTERYKCKLGTHSVGEGCRHDDECSSRFCCKDSSCGGVNTCRIEPTPAPTHHPTPDPTPSGPRRTPDPGYNESPEPISTSSPTPNPTVSSSQSPSPGTSVFAVKAMVAENESFTKNLQIIDPYNRNPYLIDHLFDSILGTKTIFVKFISNTNEELVFSASIQLIADNEHQDEEGEVTEETSEEDNQEAQALVNANQNEINENNEEQVNTEEEFEDYEAEDEFVYEPDPTPEPTETPEPTQSPEPEDAEEEEETESPAIERAQNARANLVFEGNRAEDLLTERNDVYVEDLPEIDEKKDEENIFQKVIKNIVEFFNQLIPQ